MDHTNTLKGLLWYRIFCWKDVLQVSIKLLLNVLKLQLNLSPCCIAPTMLHLHPPLSYWCFHALSHYLAYVTTELLMITCSVAIRLLLTNVLMHVKIQPIITGTTISNWIYSFDHILPNIRWLQFGWTFLRNATIRAKLWHKVCWTVIPDQSVPADLEVTMVPAWILQ